MARKVIFVLKQQKICNPIMGVSIAKKSIRKDFCWGLMTWIVSQLDDENP